MNNLSTNYERIFESIERTFKRTTFTLSVPTTKAERPSAGVIELDGGIHGN